MLTAILSSKDHSQQYYVSKVTDTSFPLREGDLVEVSSVEPNKLREISDQYLGRVIEVQPNMVVYETPSKTTETLIYLHKSWVNSLLVNLNLYKVCRI